MLISTKSKKAAVTLSYISIVVQALSQMILTRFYLDRLGSDRYGLYQMIYAVAQYILIIDLGISTVMVRYISEYEAKKDKKRVENFAFHMGIIVLGIAVIVGIAGIIVNLNIENIYGNLTPDEYVLSHRIFSVMIIQLLFTVISHYFRGMCEAYERFAFVRFVSIMQIVLNFVLAIVFVRRGMDIMGIVAANTIVVVLSTVIILLYDIFVVKFKIRFHGWDISLLRPVAALMLAMLLQAIVGYVNSSVDKTILGIMAHKSDVTVYSIAATIITMFNTIPTAISSVFQPGAVRLVSDGADGEKLTDFIIKPGRLEFMLIGGFIAGFAVFGTDFIKCWAGDGMDAAWLYVMVILIPNAVPLMQNACLSILNALDKRLYRSFILVGITVVNIIMTVVLIKLIGPFGAPLATGISYVIGHCILMNIYYNKKIGLNVRRMFGGIFKKTWMCIIGTFILTLPLILWKNDGNWLILICKAMIFCIIYAGLLFFFGINGDEKKMIMPFIDKAMKVLKIRKKNK